MSLTGSAESYTELKGSMSLPKAIQGKSAYEIALLNGFEGTEAEWLESLKAMANIPDHSLTIDKMVVGTLGYVSPEMFGAVGDGVADDTAAVQNAVNAAKYVVMHGKYKTTAPIVFPSRVHCVLNGMINYTGGDSAVVLGGSAIKITGTGEVRSTGNSCLRVSGDAQVANCVVDIFRMYSYGTAGDIILLECSNANYCVCSNMFSNIILLSEGRAYNGVHIKTSGNGYVNENTFDGLIYRSVYDAIKITNESTIWDVDGNRFLRVEGEDAARQICVEGTTKGAMANVFELRTQEVLTTPNIIHVSTKFAHNELRVSNGISAVCFDVSNGSYKRNDLSAELPSNRLFGNLGYEGATVSVNPAFAFSGNNVVFKHFATVGGCSGYIPSPYVVDYAKGVSYFPNQEIYYMNASDAVIGDAVFDMNGKFAIRANFPFKIQFPWTTVGKVRFTLKDGDTVYIDARELDTNNMYMVYATPNGTYTVRKI
jgi:hypothetical protein